MSDNASPAEQSGANSRGELSVREAAEQRRLRAAPVVSVGVRIRRLIWSVVQRTLFRLSFHTWNRWRAMLLRLFGARIGPGCTIRRTATVYYPWLLEMGAVSCLGDNVTVYNLGKVTLGERVVLSQECYICAGTHDYMTLAMPLVTMPIVIEHDAWICARAFVGPGVHIGRGAIVGACTVVFKDVPDLAIMAGNPAKHVRQRRLDETFKPFFPEAPTATGPNSTQS